MCGVTDCPHRATVRVISYLDNSKSHSPAAASLKGPPKLCIQRLIRIANGLDPSHALLQIEESFGPRRSGHRTDQEPCWLHKIDAPSQIEQRRFKHHYDLHILLRELIAPLGFFKVLDRPSTDLLAFVSVQSLYQGNQRSPYRGEEQVVVPLEELRLLQQGKGTASNET